MTKPAASMIGTTHHVNIAPPVKATSTEFIITSMETIDMNDIPIAVLNAVLRSICRTRIKVSKAIEVSSPLMIAKIMIASVGHGIAVIWKKAIVPKSPIAHPSRHQAVFLLALRHVRRHCQSMARLLAIAVNFRALTKE